MRKLVIFVILVAVLAAGGFAWYRSGSDGDPSTAGAAGPGGPGGRGGMTRPPMPVEFDTVKRAPLTEYVVVVGNLIGEATVQVVPKVNGRLASVNVKLGDPVRRGQLIAKVEDSEIREQVRAAQASYEVSNATIRQRQADLKLAETNLERNRSLLERNLLPRQTFDDTEARYQAALAQVDLAKAQFEQAKARLDELRITLANTNITSPVNGFVGKRFLDPGAFISPNAPVVSVVDISSVRLVANLVERDVKRVTAGTPAQVEVDAFPGEKFAGKVSRVAPVFDPQTRTAEMEIEVGNPGFRLKPGMYARVQLTVDTKANALTVPRNAVVDLEGKQGVFVAEQRAGRGGERGDRPQRATSGSNAPPASAQSGGPPAAPTLTARFIPVQTGIRDGERVEITGGLDDGARVVTTGAGALKDGDRIVAARGERGPGGGSGQGRGERGGAGSTR